MTYGDVSLVGINTVWVGKNLPVRPREDEHSCFNQHSVGRQKPTRETEEDGVLKDAPNVMWVGKNLPVMWWRRSSGGVCFCKALI